MKSKQWTLSVFISLVSFFVTGCSSSSIPVIKEQSFTVWTLQSSETFEAFIREFDAHIPELILSVSVREFETEYDMTQALLHASIKNELPDVVFLYSHTVLDFPHLFQPVSDFSKILTVQKFKDDYSDATHHLLDENTIWAVPLGIETLGVLLQPTQQSLLDINPEDLQRVPLTWNDFLNAYSDDIPVPFGASPLVTHRNDILRSLFWQKRKSFYNFENAEYDFASFSEPISSTALFEPARDVTSLFFSFPHSIPVSEEEGFVSQQYRFLVRYPSEAWSMVNEENNVFSVLFPVFDQTKTSSLPARIFVGAIPHAATDPLLSWKFLSFIAQKEYQRSFVLSTFMPPSRRDLFFEFQDHFFLAPWIRQASVAHFLSSPISYQTENKVFDETFQAFFSHPSEISSDLFFKTLEQNLNKENIKK